MKRRKSEIVDISFILNQKLITAKKFEKVKKKAKVIHGWDINILSPAYFSFRNNHSYVNNVQRKSVIPT